MRCEASGCGHEYLVAFSCKARCFCPSRCQHAKRLALWTLWLEERLLARDVPHRQVVLTIPMRLRAWCLYRRRLPGDIAPGRHVRALAGARHGGVDRSLSAGGAPRVRAPGGSSHRNTPRSVGTPRSRDVGHRRWRSRRPRLAPPREGRAPYTRLEFLSVLGARAPSNRAFGDFMQHRTFVALGREPGNCAA